MKKEEAIKNLEMIRVAFVEPVTKERRKFIDDTFDIAIKALEQNIDFDKRAEKVIEETVKSIWGKPPYTEVLDKIRAEIEQYQADCDLSCSDDANCRTCDRITFDTIYRIIDKYKIESEDN